MPENLSKKDFIFPVVKHTILDEKSALSPYYYDFNKHVESFPNEYDFDIELDFNFMGIEEEVDDGDDVPDELKNLMEHHDKGVQPNIEEVVTFNLGIDEDPKEVKIGALLSPDKGRK